LDVTQPGLGVDPNKSNIPMRERYKFM
jgi:hypothetical protein